MAIQPNPYGELQVGDAATDTVSFYGATPIAQRSGNLQSTSLIGTASTTSLTTDHKAWMIEVGNTLTALGLWKGGA